MEPNDNIQLFENRRIRTAWDEEREEWYFSVVDVVAVLTDQPDSRHASTYWAVLKKRLNNEGASQLLTNCKQLKMTASDGKKRLTDVADMEQLLRIIQSIPSPKAEPLRKSFLHSIAKTFIFRHFLQYATNIFPFVPSLASPNLKWYHVKVGCLADER
ncbi:MAG: hypothetical protein MSH52_01455, partial [Christensenellaceae bacterium]|nr:hypothetical protein [Christensenellaceae bacterium]